MCTVPAFRALRSALPQSEITLVGLPWAIEFVRRFSAYVDRLIEFPGFPGFPEREPQIEVFPDFLQQIQAEHFDLALQMQGSGNLSNSVVQLFGAKQTSGFYLEGLYCPDPSTFLPYPVGENEIWRHLLLMKHLDVPLKGDELEFPVREDDWQEFSQLSASLGLDGHPYAVIHPGARDPRRRWAPEKFAAAADLLAQYGFQVVLTGTSEELELTRAVAAQMINPSFNTAGRTSAGSLAALVSRARLVICNDTGVSHLAAALRIPSVVLFSASEPDRWGPLDQNLHRRVLWASAAPPSTVIREVEQILKVEPAHAA